MNDSTDREIDLLYGEIVDLRSLYRAVSSDFDALKTRFNWVIVSSCVLSALVGAVRLLDFLSVVR
jgi:hypothetical protein